MRLLKTPLFILSMIIFSGAPLFALQAQPQSTHPVWSPDGNTLAFINNTIGSANENPINFELYTVRKDGTGLTRITFNTSFEADIAWSWDSNRIAFKSYRDGNDEIYIADLISGEQINITHNPSRDHSPYWSKDGEYLYFQSDRDHELGEVYAFNFENEQTERLTDNNFNESSAVWSPDESLVAFVSNMDGDDDIYLADHSFSEVVQLTDNSLNDWYPIWSPDGRTIYFTYGNWETDEFELRSILINGTHEYTVIENTDSGNASIHPHQMTIAFGASKDGFGEIHLLDLVSDSVSTLTNQEDF